MSDRRSYGNGKIDKVVRIIIYVGAILMLLFIIALTKSRGG